MTSCPICNETDRDLNQIAIKAIISNKRRDMMPGRDGTGPQGEGAMTGRGMGVAQNQQPVAQCGQGYGAGRRQATGRGMNQSSGAGRNQGIGRGRGMR